MALDQQHTNEASDMSFFDHIEELRKRIIRSVIAIAVVAVLVFVYRNEIYEAVIFAPMRADFPTYRMLCSLSERFGMGETLCIQPSPIEIEAKEMGETFTNTMMVSFWLGLIVSFPLVFYQFWQFIKPALKKKEADVAKWAVGVSSALFLAGVVFGYFLIAPFSINFLSNFTVPGAKVSPTLNSYVNYMTMFTVPVGVLFQLPIVVYFLASIGLIGPQTMRTYRRHAIVVVFIFAAIITPPDVMSQLFIALPIMGLYEASIGVAKRVEAKREAKMAS